MHRPKQVRVVNSCLEASLSDASDFESVVMQGNIPSIAYYLVKNHGLKRHFALDVARHVINRLDGC